MLIHVIQWSFNPRLTLHQLPIPNCIFLHSRLLCSTTHSWMRPCRLGRLRPYSCNVFPLMKKENSSRSSCLKLCSNISGQKEDQSIGSDMEVNYSNTTNASGQGFPNENVIFISIGSFLCESKYLPVEDEYLLLTEWGWNSSVLPAENRFWCCSRSRSFCGCCSDSCRCNTTLNTAQCEKHKQNLNIILTLLTPGLSLLLCFW